MVKKFRFVLAHIALGAQEVQAPTGWENMQQTFARDSVYKGMLVNYTLDFNFVNDGREFIDTVYEEYGVQGEVVIIVYEWNDNEHRYDEAYSGRINLSTYEQDDITSSSNAEETGFIKKILNLEDVEIDLTRLTSLDGSPIAAFNYVPYNTEFHRIMLHSKATVKSYEGYADDTQPQYTYRPVTREEETSGTLYIGFDNEPINGFSAYSYPTGLSFAKEINELIPFAESGEITVEYSLDFYIECSKEDGFFTIGEVDYFLGVGLTEPPLNALPGTPPRIHSYNQQGLSNYLSHSVKEKGTKTFKVNNGDKLYFFGYAGVFDTSGKLNFAWKIELTGENYIRVKGATKTDPSPAFGMMIHEAYTRIIQAITGSNTAFYSELLGRTDTSIYQYAQDGELSLTWLTNGSQIRGFPLAQRPILASLKQLFNSTLAIKPIGLGVEATPNGQRVRLEAEEFFFSKEIILELGYVDDVKKSVAQEYYYNQTEFGYNKWFNNQQNSLDEVNTKQTRTTPIDVLKSTLSRVSDYATSGYLIEDIRRQQYTLAPDKESNEDKTNFFVCVLRKNPVEFETERNQLLDVCNNVRDPESIYNIRVTPMRNFLRYYNLIKASVYHQEDKVIRFNDGNANYLAETRFKGEAKSVIENMDIKGQDMPKSLYIPEYFEFTHRLRTFERKKIEANPYGVISFIDRKGKTQYGYLKEIKANVAGSSATWKLLRANM